MAARRALRSPATDPLSRVRAIALALPHVTERASHGSPSFFIRDKTTFVSYVDDHHGDGIVGIWCAAPPGEQQARIDEGPHRFFRPPYVGGRGWLGVRLARVAGDELCDDELREIITDAWCTVAPKRLLAEFESLPRPDGDLASTRLQRPTAPRA